MRLPSFQLGLQKRSWGLGVGGWDSAQAAVGLVVGWGGLQGPAVVLCLQAEAISANWLF